MPEPRWRKSTHSGSGNCVEVAELPGDHRLVRDSKNPAGPVLTVTVGEFAALLEWVKTDLHFRKPAVTSIDRMR